MTQAGDIAVALAWWLRPWQRAAVLTEAPVPGNCLADLLVVNHNRIAHEYEVKLSFTACVA